MMVAKFNSKTQLQNNHSFFLFFNILSVFDFNVCKTCQFEINLFFQNAICVSNDAEFDADFKSVIKVAKRLMQKKVAKN
jgi:hypothetical protein